MLNIDNKKMLRLKKNLLFIIILFGLSVWGAYEFYQGPANIFIALLTLPMFVWIFVFSDLRGFAYKTPQARNVGVITMSICWITISSLYWYLNVYNTFEQWAYTTATMTFFFIFAYIAANRNYTCITEH